MLILADTNFVLRLVEPAHSQHAIASEAYERLDELGHQFVIVPQVVYEFWAVVTRPIDANGLGMSVADAQSKLHGILSTMRILRDERSIYEQWRQLVVEHSVVGKQVHDARLVAAMLRHDISHMITFNTTHFSRYDEIAVVNPRQPGVLGPAMKPTNS